MVAFVNQSPALKTYLSSWASQQLVHEASLIDIVYLYFLQKLNRTLSYKGFLKKLSSHGIWRLKMEKRLKERRKMIMIFSEASSQTHRNLCYSLYS